MNPLKVKIEQKLTLTDDFIVVPERFTDHGVQITCGNGEKTTYTVYNAIKIGDRLILLQQKGGQQYLVIDRMVIE